MPGKNSGNFRSPFSVILIARMFPVCRWRRREKKSNNSMKYSTMCKGTNLIHSRQKDKYISNFRNWQMSTNDNHLHLFSNNKSYVCTMVYGTDVFWSRKRVLKFSKLVSKYAFCLFFSPGLSLSLCIVIEQQAHKQTTMKRCINNIYTIYIYMGGWGWSKLFYI